MEGFEIKSITMGKYRRGSIIYHLLEHQTRRNYEMIIDHVHKNSITLRLVSNIKQFLVLMALNCS